MEWAGPGGAAECAPPAVVLLGRGSEVLATARLPPAGLGPARWAALLAGRAAGRTSPAEYRQALVSAALDSGTTS